MEILICLHLFIILFHVSQIKLEANQYLQAMNSVGNILLYFDYDKQVPLLGFGGDIRGFGLN